MPHDMFGDVVVRPRCMRPRRSSVVIMSVIGHGAVIVALVIVPLMAADLLPPLPHSMTFVPESSIVPVLPGPPLKRPGVVNAKREHPVAQAPQVPIIAPPAIGPEKETETGDADPHALPLDAFDGVGQPVGGTRYLPPPPPAPAAPPAPVRVFVGIKPPRKLFDAPPVYPPLAQQTHTEGIVILEATIDSSGRVVDARVLKSIPLLDQAAVDAVKQWKYTPTLLSGVPVPVIMTVTVTFKLR